jgi:guanylate kinase
LSERVPADQPASFPGLLLIVSAPSGAGKTSLVSALLERDFRLAVSVSHTTRKRRTKEHDGANYHFVDEQTFAALVADQAFLEHASVFGHRYGTSRAAVTREMASGRDVILEIDYQGARQIRANYPSARSIFILPPSQTALAARLTGRGQDDLDEIRQRLTMARQEMSHYDEFDYVVVNDEFNAALADLQAIVHAERLTLDHRAPRLAALLDDLLSEP